MVNLITQNTRAQISQQKLFASSATLGSKDWRELGFTPASKHLELLSRAVNGPKRSWAELARLLQAVEVVQNSRRD